MLSSARRGISYPNPDYSDRPDVPAHMLNLVNALEVDMVYAQGTNAARLARLHLVGTMFFETDTKFTWWDDGTTWQRVGGPSQELDFQVVSSAYTAVTATTEATSQVLIQTSSIAMDGLTKVRCEFFCPSSAPASGTTVVTVVWIRDAAFIGQTRHVCALTGTLGTTISSFTYDQPSAGGHIYQVRAFANASTTLAGGPGTTGNLVGSTLRVTRA